MKNQTNALTVAICGMAGILLACYPEPRVAGELSLHQDPKMRLWQVYDHCRSATNLEEQKGYALLLHHSVLLQSDDGARTHARRSVDIGALAASCNLVAGSAMMEAGEVREATILYHHALLHSSAPALALLKGQAQRALNELRTSLQ